MKVSVRFLQVLGTTSLALLVACGDSSSSTDPGGVAGAAGAAAGAAGAAGGTAGSAGKATGGSAGSSGGGTGGTSAGSGGSDAGSGGSDAGSGGSDAGSGGSDAGSGGSDAGSGGSDAGSGGSDAGSGGSDAGSGGSDAGSGGSDAGSGGSDAGSGGSDAGSGGSDAGSGGSDAGSGGSDAGSGGSDAGSGGSDAGSGGSDAGSGGSDAGSGGSDAGSGGSSAGSGGSSAGSGGSSAGSGGSGGSGGFCPFPPCETGGSGGSAGSGGGTVCNSVNGQDQDGDGFPFPQDCNDCDPNINPGAIDIYNYDELTGAPLPADKQVDEDCDGSAVQVEKPVCDANLALAEADPIKGANAMDICQTTTANSPKWGIIQAQYVQLNGAALPNTNNANLGRGIMSAFGPNVDKQLGANMLVLSSGTARIPGQAGYSSPSGFDKGYGTPNPQGFPVNSPSCPGVNSGALRDSIGLKLRMRAPTNAKSISFKFKFYTFEYPGFICSQYNDIFVAVMRDKDGNFIEGANPQTGNISFDKDKNYLSVNAGFLEVCTPGTHGGKQFTCPLGTSELQGTGFEGHAATGWLQTNAPVKPGEEFEIIFGISDAGDGILDSSVLLDSFEWSANEGKVETGDECKLGGSGTCATCLSKQIPTCCDAQYTACINDKEGGSGNFNPGCNGILNCIQICAGNAQCQQNCYDSRPLGQPEYNAYRDCLYGPAGDPDDSGACGKVCQLGHGKPGPPGGGASMLANRAPTVSPSSGDSAARS